MSCPAWAGVWAARALSRAGEPVLGHARHGVERCDDVRIFLAAPVVKRGIVGAVHFNLKACRCVLLLPEAVSA